MPTRATERHAPPSDTRDNHHAQEFNANAIQRELARREAIPGQLLDIAKTCHRNNLEDPVKFGRMLQGAEITRDDITDAIQHTPGLRQNLENILGGYYDAFVGSAEDRARAA